MDTFYLVLHIFLAFGSASSVPECDQIQALEAKLEEALKTISHQQKEIEALWSTVSEHQTKLYSKSDNVAFTVSDGSQTTYAANERIQYSTVVTNEGGGYLMGQHEFVCPSSGMYMFTWTAVADYSNIFQASLHMNDDVIASGWASNSGSVSATNVVLIHCSSGSRVYIQCGPERSCHTRTAEYGLGDIHTFAGFLVIPQDD